MIHYLVCPQPQHQLQNPSFATHQWRIVWKATELVWKIVLHALPNPEQQVRLELESYEVRILSPRVTEMLGTWAVNSHSRLGLCNLLFTP